VAGADLSRMQSARGSSQQPDPTPQATVALVGRHRLPINGRIYRSRKAARRRLITHLVALTVAAIGIALIIMSVLVVTGRIQIIGTGVDTALVPSLMIPAYLLSSLAYQQEDHHEPGLPRSTRHHPRQHNPAHPNARSME
jgi:hypothetical protein